MQTTDIRYVLVVQTQARYNRPNGHGKVDQETLKLATCLYQASDIEE